VIGTDDDGDGRGEPVRTWRKPAVRGVVPIEVPIASDEFAGPALGLQWQWQANPRDGWLSLAAAPGVLRLFSQPAPVADNLWLVPNLLLQKLPAPEFQATAALRFRPRADGERAGLLVFGQDYAWAGLRRVNGRLRLVVRILKDAKGNRPEQELASVPAPGSAVCLRVIISAGGTCRFSAGADVARLAPIGPELVARAGDWVVAKIGVFASGPPGATTLGHADWDWFRVEPLPIRRRP
jgi:beta-xylosidase